MSHCVCVSCCVLHACTVLCLTQKTKQIVGLAATSFKGESFFCKRARMRVRVCVRTGLANERYCCLCCLFLIGLHSHDKADVEEKSIKAFLAKLRADPRFCDCHFVFICESNLSDNVASYLSRYIRNYGPITELHENVLGDYAMTSNMSKQLGYGHLSRFMNEGRIHFANDFVTTNRSMQEVKDILKGDFENMTVEREEKEGKMMQVKISGKPNTDDTVLALMIGLAKWSRFTLTNQYRDNSGVFETTVLMGEAARRRANPL